MSNAGDTPLAMKLEAIQSLAEVAQTALPLGMNAISVGPDGLLAISRPPRPTRLKFFLEELDFNVAVSPDGDGSICQIWAECGFVPYTVQSPERRQSVLAVLRASQGQSRARFAVENGQKILLIGESRISGAVTPEALIYETVVLVQEARPYLRLLAEFM